MNCMLGFGRKKNYRPDKSYLYVYIFVLPFQFYLSTIGWLDPACRRTMAGDLKGRLSLKYFAAFCGKIQRYNVSLIFEKIKETLRYNALCQLSPTKSIVRQP